MGGGVEVGEPSCEFFYYFYTVFVIAFLGACSACTVVLFKGFIQGHSHSLTVTALCFAQHVSDT